MVKLKNKINKEEISKKKVVEDLSNKKAVSNSLDEDTKRKLKVTGDSGKLTIEINKDFWNKTLKYILLVLLVVGILIGVDAGVQLYIKENMIGKVNNQYISKSELEDFLMGVGGSEYFTKYFSTYKLLEQEGIKKGIRISDFSQDDVDAKIIKLVGMNDIATVRSTVKENGMDISILEYVARIELLRDKLIGDITVTDENLESFYAEQESYGYGRDTWGTTDEAKEVVKERLYSQKAQELDERLMNESKVENYFIDKPKYKFGDTFKRLWSKIAGNKS